MNKKELFKYAGAIIVCLSVVGFVTASTTIDTSINTGGSLTVGTGSTLTGAVTMASTLNVTGLSTFTYSTTTSASFDTASTTNLVVGGGTTLTGVIMGTCTFQALAITASTTGYVNCVNATGTHVNDVIFVTATSSLANGFVIQAASTTAADTINIRLLNTGIVAGNTVGPATVYFFATH
ncbi:MAG TPA: hypothetical protein VJB98_01455 [Candidatus Paceibacterota bacterium]